MQAGAQAQVKSGTVLPRQRSSRQLLQQPLLQLPMAPNSQLPARLPLLHTVPSSMALQGTASRLPQGMEQAPRPPQPQAMGQPLRRLQPRDTGPSRQHLDMAQPSLLLLQLMARPREQWVMVPRLRHHLLQVGAPSLKSLWECY